MNTNKNIFVYLMMTIFMVLPLFSTGQLLPLENVSKKYGINRTSTYRVFTDKKGYLWVTTSPGVFRFDGHHFEEMFRGTPLQRITSYLVTEDEKGNLWFLSKDKLLFKYDGNELTTLDLLEMKSCGFNASHLLHAETVYVDSLEQVHVGLGSGIGEIVYNCKETTEDNHLEKNRESHISLDKTGENDFFYFSLEKDDNGKLIPFFGDTLPVYLKTEKKDTVIYIPVADSKLRFKRFRYYKLQNERSAIALRRRMYVLGAGNKLMIKDFDSEVIYVYEDHKGRIWVSERGGKVYVFDKELNRLNIELYELEYLAVSTIFQDQQGGYWFSTINRGLYYLRDVVFKKFLAIDKKHQESISNIEGDGKGGIYATTTTGVVYHLDSDFNALKSWEVKQGDFFPAVKRIRYLGELNAIVVGTYQGVAIIDMTSDKIFWPEIAKDLYAYDVEIIDDSTIAIFGKGSAVYLNTNWKEGKGRRVDLGERIFKSEMDSKGKIWFSAYNGLKVLEGDSLVKPFPGDSVLRQGLYDLELINDKFWGAGIKLGLVTNNGDSIHHVGAKYGVPDWGVTNIEQQDDTTIWLGTRNGLVRLILGDSGYKVKKIGRAEGIPDGAVEGINQSGDKIWLFVDSELQNFSPSDLPSGEVKSPLYITKLEEGDVTLDLTKKIELDYSEKVLSFHFRNLNFSRQGDLNYQYRLTGNSEQWLSTKEPIARYASLSPGEYSFEVRAENNNGSWTPSQKVAFSVLPAFWQTPWFFAIMLILLVLFIYLIIESRLKKKNQQEALKAKLAQLELKALKAQINPHFIFNSISSVQYYLAKNQPEDAQRYMQDFALLIRKVLEHSDSSEITLESELTLIENYIRLESRKFKGDGIRFEINVDDNVDKRKFMIPSALFQPYVENSIWHGLKNKKGERLIKIGIQKIKKTLQIEIIDNGIGREAAKKFRKRSKEVRSFGMSIATERIKVLNNSKENKHVEINDLMDTNGIPLGTKVILSIPYKVSTQ